MWSAGWSFASLTGSVEKLTKDQTPQLESLKQSLLRAVAMEDQDAIFRSAAELEETGCRDSAKVPGRWALVFSTQTEPGESQEETPFSAITAALYRVFFRFAPFLAGAQGSSKIELAGPIFPSLSVGNEQLVDFQAKRVDNRVAIRVGGSGGPKLDLRVKGDLKGSDALDLGVIFTSFSFKLPNLPDIELPLPRPEGRLRTTFCDRSLRISRGGRGGIFVLKRTSYHLNTAPGKQLNPGFTALSATLAMADFVPAVDEVDLPLPPSLPGVAKGGAAENGSTSLSPSPHRDSLSSGRASPSALAYERLDVEEDSRLRAFKQGESLGKGAYGEVFKAMVAGKFMAVKKISLDVSLGQHAVEKEINGLLQEINTLKRLKHKRIVRYQGCIRQDSEEDPALLIFLEYMPSGSIKGVLQKFGPYGIRLVKKYTRQILEGLDFLHTEKIVHRDVKGANILIDAHGDAKLADFGASQNLEALHTLHGTCTTGGVKSIHGSVFWMAPEVMKYRAGRRSDIWSLGCTVIEMITADAPWPNLREHKMPVTEMLRHIVDSDEIPPLPDKIHPDCRSFLERTLNRDHTRRPYADKLLGHRFVVEVTTPAASPGGSAAAASPVSVASTVEPVASP
ncbi:ANP2 [Symbiodinium microadriaticum]|nr:ANP2 [Symbiodinium sp. KB8]CAE7367556.1 ANP2 [Symbiodinium microadriaticum]